MTAPGDASKMTCEEFDALLPELIGTGEDINRHPHLQQCELHRAFVADLHAIAQAARQLFPNEEPADELWNRLDEAIKKQEPEPEDGKEKKPGMAASGADDDPSKLQ